MRKMKGDISRLEMIYLKTDADTEKNNKLWVCLGLECKDALYHLYSTKQ